MILDKLMEFDPVGTLITVTAVSTNVFDAHGANIAPGFSSTVKPGRDLGAGDGMTPRLCVLVTTSFTAGGAATLQIQLQGAPDNGSGIPGTYANYAETPAIALASLVAGNRIFDINWPRILPTPGTIALMPRFYRLNYVIAAGPMNAGALQADVTIGRQDEVYYPAGVAVQS